MPKTFPSFFSWLFCLPNQNLKCSCLLQPPQPQFALIFLRLPESLWESASLTPSPKLPSSPFAFLRLFLLSILYQFVYFSSFVSCKYWRRRLWVPNKHFPFADAQLTRQQRFRRRRRKNSQKSEATTEADEREDARGTPFSFGFRWELLYSDSPEMRLIENSQQGTLVLCHETSPVVGISWVGSFQELSREDSAPTHPN